MHTEYEHIRTYVCVLCMCIYICMYVSHADTLWVHTVNTHTHTHTYTQTVYIQRNVHVCAEKKQLKNYVHTYVQMNRCYTYE